MVFFCSYPAIHVTMVDAKNLHKAGQKPHPAGSHLGNWLPQGKHTKRCGIPMASLWKKSNSGFSQIYVGLLPSWLFFFQHLIPQWKDGIPPIIHELPSGYLTFLSSVNQYVYHLVLCNIVNTCKYHSSVTSNYEWVDYKPPTSYAHPRGLSQNRYTTGPLWNHALRSTKADLDSTDHLGFNWFNHQKDGVNWFKHQKDGLSGKLRILNGLVWKITGNIIPSIGQS